MTILRQPNSKFNDSGLYTLHLAELRHALSAFTMHLGTEDLPVLILARYASAFASIDEALLDLTCETCSDPIAEAIGMTLLCTNCAEKWTLCDGCGSEVLISDAVSATGADSGFYHAACTPDGGPDGVR